MSRTRVAVTGLPFFGRKAAANLRAAGLRATYVPSLREALKQPATLAALLRADVVYAIGPSIERRSPLDILAKLRTRIVIHWVGSDVGYAVRAAEAGTASGRLIRHATHIADAPWLAGELHQAGIDAGELALPIDIAFGTPPAAPPDAHRVLVFLPRVPHDAYDVEGTLAVARNLREVPFTVVGGFEPADPPPNLTLRGFVDDMASVYREHTVYLRLVHHDGLAHTVIEALSFGLRVVWNYPLPGVDAVSGAGDAIAAIRAIVTVPPAPNEAGLGTAGTYRGPRTIPAVATLLEGVAKA